MTTTIPIILFTYSRPDHLRRTLDCLLENNVSLIYAFSDGPRSPDKEPVVTRVREMLRTIDWCEVVLCEHETNLGLGRSILTGVSDVLVKHDAAIIFEDDLICIPGTYDYLCAALNQYKDDPRVMSVTGWNHSLITPSDITDQPYFDGRAECWVWGTWARTWNSMQEDALTTMKRCQDNGIDIFRYGTDLPAMASVELKQNIWAVRFLYWHIINAGLCLRPPWSMVEHIGFDSQATNASDGSKLSVGPLRPCPPIPMQWPEPVEHPACSRLHRKIFSTNPSILGTMYRFASRLASKTLHKVFPKREF